MLNGRTDYNSKQSLGEETKYDNEEGFTYVEFIKKMSFLGPL